jgi:hypothetical protein
MRRRNAGLLINERRHRRPKNASCPRLQGNHPGPGAARYGFPPSLLREAVECIINGDLTTGKAVLRDYVNATVGFHDLEKRTRIPAKSLMRMLGPKGSPSAANLSSILTALQKTEGVQFELALKR